MGGRNVIIDRTADFRELNSRQLGNGADFNGVSLLIKLILRPDEFVRMLTDLLWFNGLLDGDSKAPDTLLDLVRELQQSALAVVLVGFSTGYSTIHSDASTIWLRIYERITYMDNEGACLGRSIHVGNARNGVCSRGRKALGGSGSGS
jgi:hypothetical protein